MTSNSRIRILLVDDHALFRDGLWRLLEPEPDFELVYRCGEVVQALQFLAQYPVDILLLDYRLDQEQGSELLRNARQMGFKGKVLMVTAGLTSVEARDLIALGISGVFLKHDSPALLAQCIREVMAGRTWFASPQVQSLIVTETPLEGETEKKLTERQRTVLRAVLEGRSNKEIALQVGVSESAIKAVLQQLFTKMEVRSRSQLVRAVLERYRELL